MKRILSLFLAALMLVTVGTTALAVEDTVYTSGDYEYTLTEDGEVKITGYIGTDTDVTIPAVIDGYNVFSVGNYAFEYNEDIRSVVVSEGIKNIGYRAFYDCNNLESVVIADSVAELGYESNSTSFEECDNLKTVYIGKGLFGVKGGEFNGCPSLEEIVISEENPYLTAEDLVIYTKDKKTLVAFCDYYADTFTVPEGVRVIGNHAFGYSKLQNIIFNDDLLLVAMAAFVKCDELEEIVLPNSINEFLNLTFKECNALTSVTMPEAVKYIDDGMLSKCFNLDKVYIPAGVDGVNKEAFYSWDYDLDPDNYKVPVINFFFGGNEAQWSALEVDTRDTVPVVNYNHTHEYNCTNTVSECAVCGLKYSNSHVWEIKEVVYPVNGVDGYIDLVCATDSSHTKRESISAAVPGAEEFYYCIAEYEKIFLESDWIDSIAASIKAQYADMVSDFHEYIYGERYMMAHLLGEDIPELKELLEAGEFIKPDYSEFDALVEAVEKAIDGRALTEEAQASFDSIKESASQLRADGEKTKAEYQPDVDALSDKLELLKAGVESGEYVTLESVIEKLNALEEELMKEASEKYGDALSELVPKEETLERVEKTRSSINALEGTVLENKDAIAQLEKEIRAFWSDFERCLSGEHNVSEYTSNGDAACNTDGTKTGKCTFCATGEKTVKDEGTALVHEDKNGDYKCDFGCGYEFEKPADPEEPTEPEKPSDACSHLCHKEGLMGIIWKVIRFITKLFKINPVCKCGEAHY